MSFWLLFLLCVGFVFVGFALFLFVLLLECFWCCSFYFLGVCCFCFCFSCLFCLFVLESVCVCVCARVFSCVFWGLLLFCSLCLLEWSRCCSCLVRIGFVLFVFVICLCLFLSVSCESHCFPYSSSVFCSILVQSLFLISAFGSCFLFYFVGHLFQDVPFVFYCLLSCFVFNHKIVFLIIRILCSCCFLVCYPLEFISFDFWLQKHLSKNWKFRKPQQ